MTNTVTGLKIPLSSIVTKEFYTIPSKYATTDKETQQTGFMVEGADKNGNSTSAFVAADIYAQIEDESTETEEGKEPDYIYYVDKKKFKEVLDQNEEYAIVSKNTSYGLSRYDHIVRNADKVNEEEILY